ncbi:hypothetical protein Esti_006413 [Eimeria stiedai]
MATIITTPSAAAAIKTYSPELIVYPFLPGRAERPYEHETHEDHQKELARIRLMTPVCWTASASALYQLVCVHHPIRSDFTLARVLATAAAAAASAHYSSSMCLLLLQAEPVLRKADVVVIGPGLGGALTNMPKLEDEERQRRQQEQQQQQQEQQHQKEQQPEQEQQQQQQQQPPQQQTSEAVQKQNVHKAVRPTPSHKEEKAAAAAAAAAADGINPLNHDPNLLRNCLHEMDVVAGSTQRAALMLLRLAMILRKPLVLDADMLRILCMSGYERHMAAFARYPLAVLTPNAYEMELLHRALRKMHAGGIEPPTPAESVEGLRREGGGGGSQQAHALLPETLRREDIVQRVADVTDMLQGPSLFSKGRLDVLGAPQEPQHTGQRGCSAVAIASLDRRFVGAPKRSAGQGDVLCGVLAQLMVWMERARLTDGFSKVEAEAARLSAPLPFRGKPATVSLLLMHAASALTRQAASLAFKDQGRSMSAGNVLDNLGAAAAALFPSGWGHRAALRPLDEGEQWGPQATAGASELDSTCGL